MHNAIIYSIFVLLSLKHVKNWHFNYKSIF